jgi:hypothetical protein
VPYRVYVPLDGRLTSPVDYSVLSPGVVKNRQLADKLDQCQVVVKQQAAQLREIRALQPDQAE